MTIAGQSSHAPCVVTFMVPRTQTLQGEKKLHVLVMTKFLFEKGRGEGEEGGKRLELVIIQWKPSSLVPGY